MTENKKNISYFPLFISTSLTVFSLVLFGVFLFENKETFLKENTNSQKSEINLFIEKFQSQISQLDQLQQSIGTVPTPKLIETYNALSNDFNQSSVEILGTPELKEDPVLKNTVIAANNQTTEYLDAIKKQLSTSKKNLVSIEPYLKNYVSLKSEISNTMGFSFGKNQLLFFPILSLLGFILFSAVTVILGFRILMDQKNKLFQTESELKTFKSVINNMSEGVIVTNPLGYFTYYNQAALDIIGSNIHDINFESSVQLLGFHDTEGNFISKKDLPFATGLQKTLSTDQEIFVKNSKNPEGIFISASNGFFVNQKAETAGSVVVMKNITHKKNMEALWIKEKEAAIEGSKKKSDFLASMSHEIRTPMNGIIGLTTLMNETPLNPEQKEYVGIIKRSANALLSLINDILDHSKIEAGKVELVHENFSLKVLTHDVIENFKYICSEKNIAIQCNYPAELNEHFQGDGNRLRQILMNLIGNAVKFTPTGQITLNLTFTEKNNHQEILFEIQDTGVGMEPHEVERLFQRFFQTRSGLKFGGTGLGLSISKQLVDLMGGSIGVHSQINQGTTFWFKLNLEKGIEQNNEVVNFSLAYLENVFSGHILVAEDNPVNQKVVYQYLSKMGFTVDLANNGKEAVEMFQAKSYDLIFMDCQMPVMTGYAATQEIIQLQSAQASCVPIIALTAEGTSGEKAKCFAAGMNDFLNKPLVFEQLALMLTKYFKAHKNISLESEKQSALPTETAEIYKLCDLKVGDQLLLEILLEEYKTSSFDLIQNMKKAITDQNDNSLTMAAHTLKSASATLSATKVSQLCEQIENLNIPLDINQRLQLIEALSKEYTQSIEQIHNVIIEIKDHQMKNQQRASA